MACTTRFSRDGRPRPGHAGQVERGVVVHERQRHELGEAAGGVLDPGERAAGGRASGRRCRRGRTSSSSCDRMPSPVRRGHDLHPQRGGQLALGQDPADVVVEDLRRGARDGVEPGVAQPAPASRAIDSPALVAAVTTSIGLNACTCIPGTRAFTARTISAYAVPGRLGVDAALHADLGGAGGPRLLGPVGDLVDRQRVGVGVRARAGRTRRTGSRRSRRW